MHRLLGCLIWRSSRKLLSMVVTLRVVLSRRSCGGKVVLLVCTLT